MVLVFRIEQFIAWYNMQTVLNSNSSIDETFSLTLSNFNKQIVGKNEIEINGKRFDIKSLKIVENMVIFTAVHDQTEESILAQLNQYLKQSHHTKSKQAHQLQNLLTSNYIINNSLSNFFITQHELNYSLEKIQKTKLKHTAPSIPPPNYC